MAISHVDDDTANTLFQDSECVRGHVVPGQWSFLLIPGWSKRSSSYRDYHSPVGWSTCNKTSVFVGTDGAYSSLELLHMH